MKKLIALMLIAVMLMPIVVYCCDGISAAVLPTVDESTDLYGEVWVAVQASTGCLFGKLSPVEKVKAFPVQTDAGRVRGITGAGVNRAKGEMRYVLAGETVCGLTRVTASIHIDAQYLAVVTEIVRRNLGEDAAVTASSVVACTIHRTQITVTHRMVGRNAGRVAVGNVLFTGAEMSAVIYATDWDGDGLLDLVFSVNPGPATTVEPKPTNTANPGKPSKPVVTQKPGCNKKCIEITINIEKLMVNHLNIDSIFKPCNKSVEGC